MNRKKTVLITGGAGGIGSAMVRAFCKAGYDVVFSYLSSESEAQALSNEGAGVCFRADVREAEQVAALVNFAERQVGGVDILINNAGISSQKLFTDISEKDWDDMFDVCVKGTFNMTKSVLPLMINKKSGKIINISSIWGLTGASCETHYSAAKAAIIGFTKALSKEVALSGITVNAIAPGAIGTKMLNEISAEDLEFFKEETPMGRIGTPEDVAGAALYIAEADFLTGQVISPNGGAVI